MSLMGNIYSVNDPIGSANGLGTDVSMVPLLYNIVHSATKQTLPYIYIYIYTYIYS
jgi:hypothetical protein